MKLGETNRIGLLTIFASPFYATLSVAVLQKAYSMDGVPGCIFLSPFLFLPHPTIVKNAKQSIRTVKNFFIFFSFKLIFYISTKTLFSFSL